MSDNSLKVSRRGGFADRNNINPVNTTMQYTCLDNRTRIALTNAVSIMYGDVFEDFNAHGEEQLFLKSIMAEVYIQNVDFRSGHYFNTDQILRIINNTILNDEYQAVLTIIEYIAQKFVDISYGNVPAFEYINEVFKKEFVGYRFVEGFIVAITDETEISEIKDAANIKKNKVDLHIHKALQHLSNREKPDYENSIKESISAVEAMCNLIVGKKTTLGDALKKLKGEGAIVHPALETAFEKLYGYTSDASGIRHAGQIDGPDSTFEEAKFMVVACSGFVNYLNGLRSSITNSNIEI